MKKALLILLCLSISLSLCACGDLPIEDILSGFGQSGDKSPDGEQPDGEQPDGEQPGGEQPGGEQPGGEQPGGEQPGGEQPGGENPDGEQPNSESGVIYELSADGTYASVVGYKGTPTKLIIDDSYQGVPVKTIKDEAFYECASLVSLTIGNNVTSIGDRAFCNCNSLTSVTIGYSVKNIGYRAFLSCFKLVEIINKSTLNITAGSSNDGFVAFYGIEVHNGDSKVVNRDGYLFYTYDDVNYLLGFTGNKTDLVFPDNFNGQNYEVYRFAFYNCDNIISVTIPDSVTAMGNSAFENCTSLTSVTMGDNVTSINDYVFSSCTNLVSVTIGNSVTGIGEASFYECTNLARMTIPDSVTSIGCEAFGFCTSLTSITIGNGVTSIGEQAFSGCTSLTSVIIPDGVTNICKGTFGFCISLMDVSFGDGVTEIGECAFKGCESLVNITLTEGITAIGECAFSDCKSLTNIVVSDGNKAYKSKDGSLYSKDGKTLIQYAIGKTDTEFTIPDGVTSIGKEAFYNCNSLTSVTISESVMSVGKEAFKATNINIIYYLGVNNNAIEGINRNDNETLYRSTWYYVEKHPVSTEGLLFSLNEDEKSYTVVGVRNGFNKTDVEISTCNGFPVTGVDSNAFAECLSIVTITISDSVAIINANALRGCTSLSYISVDEKNTAYKSIDGNLYSLADKTLIQYAVGKADTEFTVPDGITGIGEYAVGGCTSLVKVTISNGVTSIGERAFYGCTSLTSVTMPNSVVSIGDRAFAWCEKLETVIMSNGLKSIGDSAFLRCLSLESITIPDSLTSLGINAFSNCWYLTKVYYYGKNRNGIEGFNETDNGNIYRADWYYIERDPESTKGLIFILNKGGESYTVTGVIDGFAETDIIISTCNGLPVTGIDAYSFKDCTGIESVTLSDNVGYVGIGAFFGCTSLTNVTISYNATHIGLLAFSCCTQLVNITVDENNSGYKSIDGNLYSKDGKTLVQYAIGKTDTEFTVSDSVTTIVDSAFEGCASLVSVTIGKNVTNIGYDVFSGCKGLKSVTIGKNVKNISWRAFYLCTSLTDISVDENNVAYKSIDGSLYSKDGKILIQYAIGKNDTEFVIPDNVSDIGVEAFCGCASIVSVTIPEGMTHIGEKAFLYCKGLTDVYYYGKDQNDIEGLNEIDNPELNSATWYYIEKDSESTEGLIFSLNEDGESYTVTGISDSCTKTDIVISTYNGLPVTSIGNSAFKDCKNLTSVTISNTVTSIGEAAFFGCENLSNVTIPESVTNIGMHAFAFCTSFTHIIIPSSITHIENYLLGGCTNLVSVIIPDSVISIKYGAFWECKSLATISIPSSVTSIEDFVFFSCTSLESIIVSENNQAYKSIDGNLYTKDEKTFVQYCLGKADTSFIIPESVIDIGLSAFYGCQTLESVTMGVCVSRIFDYAFDGCINLRNVVFPQSLRSIGNYSFRNCDSFTSIIIPDGVISLGEETFRNCDKVTRIIIPNSVTSIGMFAVNDCTSLKDVYYYGKDKTDIDGVNEYYNRALCNATWHYIEKDSESTEGLIFSLNEDGESYTVTGISDSCTKTDIVISTYNGLPVTSIGNSAFKDCKNLRSVIISDTVTSISGSAFQSCRGLASVTIPNSVTVIGDQAFYGCPRLIEVINRSSLDIERGSQEYGYVGYYAKTVHEGESLILDYGDYRFTTIDGVNYLVGYYGNESNLTLPDNYNGESYVIWKYAFYNNNNLISVSIPNFITHIEIGAFMACTSLTNVMIPESVTGIGDSAFRNCVSLVRVIIPDSVNSIGAGAFIGCDSLASVTLGTGVTSIGEYAFNGCDSLASVTLGTGVTSIGEYAFNGCWRLFEVINKSSLNITADSWEYGRVGFYAKIVHKGESLVCIDGDYTYITLDGVNYLIDYNGNETHLVLPEKYNGEGYAIMSTFDGNDFLISVTIPDSVTAIGEDAFFGCSSLTSVTIPDSVTAIGNFAFYGCSSLTSVTIPDSVTAIGKSAFSWCSSLTSVTIPDSVTAIGDSAFSCCSSLTNVTIPDGVTSIGDYAFRECSSLTSVTIPDSVTAIGKAAFVSCSGLTSITIPEGVTSIGDYAFASCFRLTSITIPDSVTSIGNSAFSSCSGLISVTIGCGVTSIGNSAFRDCQKLVEVINKSSLNIEIGSQDYGQVGYYAKTVHKGESMIVNCEDYLFITADGVNYLLCYIGAESNLILPDNYNGEGYVIIDAAFDRNDKLTGVTIPSCVTEIGEGTFRYFSNLESITVDDSNSAYKSIDGNLYSKDGKTLIQYAPGKADKKFIIPESVTTIAPGAFYGCTSLASVTIPDGVTSIGDYAFSGCTSLTSVTIPDGVTSIDYYAFSGCTSLTSVTFKNPEGWWRSRSSSATSGDAFSSSDLSDASVAAKYLTKTYIYYNWRRG